MIVAKGPSLSKGYNPRHPRHPKRYRAALTKNRHDERQELLLVPSASGCFARWICSGLDTTRSKARRSHAAGQRGAPRAGPIDWRGTASGVIDKSYSLDFLNPAAGRVG